MIKLLLTMFLMWSLSLYAKDNNIEKNIEIKVHVNKIVLSEDKTYRLELRARAAVYHATEEFLPCLNSSIKENKKVLLKVAAYSLIVKGCSLD
jgi:hypothetical protein